MPAPTGAPERPDSVAEALERVTLLFQNPTPAALQTASALLDHATRRLQGEGHQGDFRRMRAAASRSQLLIASAASYFEAWNRSLGALSSGYTGTGDAAPVVRPGQLSVSG